MAMSEVQLNQVAKIRQNYVALSRYGEIRENCLQGSAKLTQELERAKSELEGHDYLHKVGEIIGAHNRAQTTLWESIEGAQQEEPKSPWTECLDSQREMVTNTRRKP